MAFRDLDDETLEALSGEVLPARVLMSVIIPSPVRGERAEVFYACQTTHYYGTPGLLGTGLLAQEARDTTTCVPAVVQTF
ncbi:hypothetical protein [Actinomadura rudentiformis]|uniref:Uncharacterized protein n=1 Tax=Actinomadura rudentiformis TaxID=359158 RepID=A0A6H9YRX8_9ACTN|nr:hypothetical protein [Actinomadura rudentiformis]KAB2342183.1 hypothetical protein F8566_39685 [Actinomadura rudentiformis]